MSNEVKAEWAYKYDHLHDEYKITNPKGRYFGIVGDECTAKEICDRFNRIAQLEAEKAEMVERADAFMKAYICEHPIAIMPEQENIYLKYHDLKSLIQKHAKK